MPGWNSIVLAGFVRSNDADSRASERSSLLDLIEYVQESCDRAPNPDDFYLATLARARQSTVK